MTDKQHSTVTVTLGGEAYEIMPLNMKASRVWRKTLGEPVGQIVDAMQSADAVALDDLGSIGQLLDVAKRLAMGSIDLCVEALFAYSPALQADRETIEENATDAEAMAAFVEVLKLAYPFGALLTTVSGGLRQPATSKKSRSQSGT